MGVTPGALDDKLVINGPSVLLNVSKSLSLELLISPQQSHFSSHNVTLSSHSQESLERIWKPPPNVALQTAELHYDRAHSQMQMHVITQTQRWYEKRWGLTFVNCVPGPEWCWLAEAAHRSPERCEFWSPTVWVPTWVPPPTPAPSLTICIPSL